VNLYVTCKCPVRTAVRWIVFMVVAVLCMWLSDVYCVHLMCMCGLLTGTCGVDCIDNLF
jgi:hypothetical protein